MHKIATYREIMEFWDLNEVLLANELLDIQEDIEWYEVEHQKRLSHR